MKEGSPALILPLWPLPYNPPPAHAQLCNKPAPVVTSLEAHLIRLRDDHTSKTTSVLLRKLEEKRAPARWSLSQPKSLAEVLVFVWIFACLLFVGFSGFNYGGYQLMKGVALLLMWILVSPQGPTHICVDEYGVTLESKSGDSVLKSRRLPVYDTERIYMEPSKNKNLLGATVCIQMRGGPVHKIKMNKFAEAQRWRAFVAAIKEHSQNVSLDENYLDPLSLQVDTSFTKLWLDALAAPPRRQRLQPLSPGTTLQNERFSIQEQLGSGGQGNAYLAQCNELGTVVLKEFILPLYVDARVRKQALSEFERESLLLSKLSHPGIIRVFDTFIEDQRAYLVLERADGASLKELVEKGGVLSEAQTIEIALQLCDILAHLHGQSPPLIHQDFTPDNLIKSDCGIKLIDFSGTRTVEGQAATVVGKRNYMPPEQFRGEPTTQSDIYALGCTLSYLITGIDPQPISQAHPKAHNAAISERFNAIIEKATALDLAQRYLTAAALADDLNSLAQASPSIAGLAPRKQASVLS